MESQTSCSVSSVTLEAARVTFFAAPPTAVMGNGAISQIEGQLSTKQ